jgi:tripartite-type tricarboxylate transporter receptor subunit TctC
MPHIKAGKLRALAVTGTTRSHVLPDIPTLADDLPGYELGSWYGLGVPRGTPVAAIDALNRAVNAVLDEPAFKAQIADMGGTLMPGPPVAFGKLIMAEAEKVAKVIEGANITIE